MNKKRLIITSIISILLVSILMIGSTYSIFTTTDVDENVNVYTTGNLNITYTLSEDNIQLTNSNLMNENEAKLITPYRITISNVGTVPYQFDLILTDTTAGEVIDYQYIMIQVGKLEPKYLNECTGNVIKEDIIVPAGDSVDIDVRVWISDKVQNTEMGKSFYAKLTIDGLAIYDNSTDIDNSVLIADNITFLSAAEPGSYVVYLGRNGCDFDSGSCGGKNANYSSSTLGYCEDSTYEFTTMGWRVAYISEESAYLISAGSPECMCTNSDGTTSNTACSSNESTTGTPLHLANLDSKALTYCNSTYAYGGVCNSSNSYSFNDSSYQSITGKTLTDCANIAQSTACGYQNSLIDVGSNYWFKKAASTGINTFCRWEYYSTIGYDFIGGTYSNHDFGVRPILRLDPSVYIIGGSGTEEDPYRIATEKNMIIDISGNGNHGINQDATWDESSGTIITDGQTNYVDAGLMNYDFGDDITMVARVKLNSINTSATNALLGNWEVSGGGIGIGPSSWGNNFYFDVYISDGYKYFISTTKPATDTWYTLVGTYDGTNLKFYINGVEESLNTSYSGATNTATGNITPGKYSIFVGANPQTGLATYVNSSNVGADAIFDDVLIFDRALTADEIASDYAGEINVQNPTDLLLYYNFE